MKHSDTHRHRRQLNPCCAAKKTTKKTTSKHILNPRRTLYVRPFVTMWKSTVETMANRLRICLQNQRTFSQSLIILVSAVYEKKEGFLVIACIWSFFLFVLLLLGKSAQSNKNLGKSWTRGSAYAILFGCIDPYGS